MRALTLLVLLSLPCSAQGQGFKNFLRFVGRETKLTFTDLSKDREWRSVVGIWGVATTADLVTTCRNFAIGGHEVGPVLNGGNNCAASVALGSALTIAGMIAVRASTDYLISVCERDNLAAEEWKHGDPKACRHFQLVGLLPATQHAWAAYGNECNTNGGCVIRKK